LLVIKLYHGEQVNFEDVTDYYPETDKENMIHDICDLFCVKTGICSD